MSAIGCSLNNLAVRNHMLSTTTKQEATNDLDNILLKLSEKTSKYQIKNYIFIFIPVLFSSIFTLSFIFTSRNLNYRCFIDGCDTPESKYETDWVRNAVPTFRDGVPSRCERYAQNINTSRINNSNSNDSICPAVLFNRNMTERCDKFIFDTDRITILREFELLCDENVWKLTLVGTLNSIGYFLGLPLAGILSDRFGRRTVLLSALTLSATMGVLRSFSISYYWFLIFESMDTFFGAGAYDSGFILGVELVPPDKRVLISTLISSSYPIGEATVGLVAWATQSWRHLLRFLYIPGFMFIGFFWLTPESIKWLMSKGRYEEVKTMIRNASKMNNVPIPDHVLEKLEYKNEKEEQVQYPFKEVLKSKILIMRLLNCSFCWITCSFVYSGLSLNSVSVSGNAYLNYILVSVVEIPGYFVTYIVLDRCGRRMSLCGSLLLSGIACLVFIFLPANFKWLKLPLYLTGKFAITISFTVIYVIITEIFPTPLRHSLLGTCSMFGSMGSMISPQTLLLAEFMESLPVLLFGAMTVTSGLLVLLLPETLNTKLPDTIEEAETIGRKAATELNNL